MSETITTRDSGETISGITHLHDLHEAYRQPNAA